MQWHKDKARCQLCLHMHQGVAVSFSWRWTTPLLQHAKNVCSQRQVFTAHGIPLHGCDRPNVLLCRCTYMQLSSAFNKQPRAVGLCCLGSAADQEPRSRIRPQFGLPQLACGQAGHVWVHQLLIQLAVRPHQHAQQQGQPWLLLLHPTRIVPQHMPCQRWQARRSASCCSSQACLHLPSNRCAQIPRCLQPDSERSGLLPAVWAAT